jgi:hypothetical protein
LLSAFPAIAASGFLENTHPFTVAVPFQILTGFPYTDKKLLNYQ